MPTSALQNIAILHQISVKTGIFRGRTGSSAPTVQKGKSTRIRRKITIKRVLSAGRCGHRPLRRETENAAVFHRTRAVFPIPFVGADDSVRPLKCYEFALDFRKAVVFCGSMWASTPTAQNRKCGGFSRVDVGIDPYDAESQFVTVICRGRCPHRPGRMHDFHGKRGDSI